jgi:pre-mRNA-splicing factor ATP-dependent RNA helicase DHX15/PRP43
MSFNILKNGIFDPEGKYPNPLTGQPYSKSYKILALGDKSLNIKGWSSYSAWEARLDIIKKIHQKPILLLVLPTGVGKTVIVPKLLLHYFEYKKRVVVTVPRLTVGAEAGAYAAKLLDVPLYAVNDIGQEIINPDSKDKEDNLYPTGNKIVGYKNSTIGTKFGDDNSMLLFTTDGNIKQKIVTGDKDLSNYGGIIIDEAHERNINIDILIALVMDIIPRRPDFKVIIMSATIKKSIFTDYFKRIGLGDKYNTFSLDEVKTNFKIDLETIRVIYL